MTTTRPPVDYIARTREQYAALDYPAYQWVENADTPPWAPASKPLRESRIALIASGGIYSVGQPAFHFKDDTSFRVIDTEASPDELRTTHFAYDLTDARRDINVVFPIEALRSLEASGEIGELAKHAYTFMGGIYSARRVRDRLAPAIADRVESDEVDLALLVPV